MNCDVISIPSLNAVDYLIEKQVLASCQADAYRFWLKDEGGFCLEEIRTRSNAAAGWNLQASSQCVVAALINNIKHGLSDDLQKKLLHILDDENSQLLVQHGYGMYTVATMSRYIGQDYTCVIGGDE